MGLLKALKNVYFNQGGTVSYIFVHERTIFTDKYPLGKTIKLRSSTVAPINTAMFIKENGSKRSPQEVLEVFQTTKDDMGASYFIIN